MKSVLPPIEHVLKILLSSMNHIMETSGELRGPYVSLDIPSFDISRFERHRQFPLSPLSINFFDVY